MSDKIRWISNISKSGFVRSVVARVLAIFIIFSIIIVVWAFNSFTGEVRKTVLAERQAQLVVVEKTISERMDEITSIAYNIGNDPAFYLEPVDDNPNTGREMSEMLGRYLVGNNFIEHLAYCRVAEPDKIYICTGERSLKEFFLTSFGMDEETADFTIKAIHSENTTQLRINGEGDNTYFSYSYPLPQLAEKPKAHVLMLIPVGEVQPMLQTLQSNDNSAVAVFDAAGKEIYVAGELSDEVDITDFVKSDLAEQIYKSPSGQKYVLQKVVSETNNWSYVAIMRDNDTLSGLANKQIAFIVVILLLLVAAVAVMLLTIIAQYKPISALAKELADSGESVDEGNFDKRDERALLSDKIAILKDDSEQKQKYEMAFYEAEAASKAKSAFLSSMSHDIRTPMNAIIGMTAIARKHIDDKDYVDECLKKVQVSSDYLLDIINNVLDMSRIESGRIPIVEEPVAITALIDSVVSLMTSSIEAKSQKFHVDVDEIKQNVVLGDSIHMVQVFVNILSNAIKFTPEGGEISLKIRQMEAVKTKDEELQKGETEMGEAETGNYEFIFSDTGIGIPPEFMDQVFDTFARAGGADLSGTEGTGLGMAIAKRLVEMMNGTIKCESELGKGTIFTVTMHMKYSDEGEIISHAGISGEAHAGHSIHDQSIVDLTGRRILLVEDNDMNREIARCIISETNADIEEAYDGKKAVEAFSSHPEGYYDLILMDIQMPVMNGHDAAVAIRAMERPDSQTVPIYALTANTFDEDVRQVRDAGMNGHIGKPYNPQVLYQTLSRVFAGAKHIGTDS